METDGSAIKEHIIFILATKCLGFVFQSRNTEIWLTNRLECFIRTSVRSNRVRVMKKFNRILSTSAILAMMAFVKVPQASLAQSFDEISAAWEYTLSVGTLEAYTAFLNTYGDLALAQGFVLIAQENTIALIADGAVLSDPNPVLVSVPGGFAIGYS